MIVRPSMVISKQGSSCKGGGGGGGGGGGLQARPYRRLIGWFFTAMEESEGRGGRPAISALVLMISLRKEGKLARYFWTQIVVGAETR